MKAGECYWCGFTRYGNPTHIVTINRWFDANASEARYQLCSGCAARAIAMIEDRRASMQPHNKTKEEA